MMPHFASRSLVKVVLFLALAGEFLFLAKPSLPSSWKLFGGAASFETYATGIVAKCKDAKNRASCYDKEIPKLMDTISMEDAFHVTTIVQDKDPSYRYCHVLGHELSAREVSKDPDKWQEVVTRCPSGVCSNGCLHGGFQERFRAESLSKDQVEALVPTLQTICEARTNWTPTGLERASCYHALGHLTMYLTGGDITEAVSLCGRVAMAKPDSIPTPLCYDGAFMQIFQPLEPEDIALIKGKEVTKEKAWGFCAQFPEKQKEACWTESWPLFFHELTKPEGLVAHCDKLEGNSRDRCYSGLVYVFTAEMGFNPDVMGGYCEKFPAGRRGQCFADVATRFIETDYRNIQNSAKICKMGDPFDPDHRCYKDLVFYASYNFHEGSDAYFAMCNALPDTWKTQCLSKNPRRIP